MSTNFSLLARASLQRHHRPTLHPQNQNSLSLTGELKKIERWEQMDKEKEVKEKKGVKFMSEPINFSHVPHFFPSHIASTSLFPFVLPWNFLVHYLHKNSIFIRKS